MSEIITVSPLCHCIFCPIDIEFREESHIRNCLRSVETILGGKTWDCFQIHIFTCYIKHFCLKTKTVCADFQTFQ